MKRTDITKQRKAWICLLAFLTIVFLAVFILSVVYKDEFDFGISSDSLFATLLFAILCLESVLERNAKYIYPITLAAYFIVTLFARFFISSIDLLVSPIISWGSLCCFVIASITATVIIVKKKKSGDNTAAE